MRQFKKMRSRITTTGAEETIIRMADCHPPGQLNEALSEDVVEDLLVNYRERLKELHPNAYSYRQRKDSLETEGTSGNTFSETSQAQVTFNDGMLRTSINEGDHESLRRHLEDSPLITLKQKPFTLLHHAVDENQEECVKVLLEAGCDVRAKDDMNRTPIFYSLFNTNTNIMELLLEADSDPNVQDKEKMTAALYASAFGQASALEVLLRIADLKICNGHGRSALHYAAVQRNPRCLELILRHVSLAEVNQRDKNQETAVHLAALAKQEANIKLLLEAGADPTLDSKGRLTPAHYSSYLWDTDSLKRFIETGKIDINLGDEKTRTLLHLASMKSQNSRESNRTQLDCIQYLSQLKDINLDKLDTNKQTALGYAVQHDSILAKLLITAGANVDGSSIERIEGEAHLPLDCIPPLHQATLCNQLESVLLLLNETRLINAKDLYQRTALHIATQREDYRIVKALLHNKADFTIRNGDQKNALELAVEQANPALVSLIMMHVAYPIDNNIYEFNLEGFLVNDDSKPETELLQRINVIFKESCKKDIFSLPGPRVFLNIKEKILRKLEIVWIFVTLSFLGLGFIFFYQDANCLYKCSHTDERSASNETTDSTEILDICFAGNSLVNICWLIWLPCLPPFVISEVMEFKSYPKAYLTNLENYLEFVLIVSFIVLSPYAAIIVSVEAHKVIVIISMIVCGLDFILALGDMTNIWKVQIMMFRAVLQRALLLLIPFIPLLLCFSVGYHTVMQLDPITEETSQQHRRVFYSFMETLRAMVGNIETPPMKEEFPMENKAALAFLMLSFIFLIIVVMMNLLTGMAVNITEDFRKDAEYRATQRRVITTYQKETMLASFRWFARKSFTLRSKLEKNGKIKIRIYNSKTTSFGKYGVEQNFVDKLNLYLGSFDERERWPMSWLGVKIPDVIAIERAYKRAKILAVGAKCSDEVDKAKIMSSSATASDPQSQSLQDDIDWMKEEMGQIKALLLNMQHSDNKRK